MPPSKQVRSRQNRQKERIVVSRAQNRRRQRRRRIIGVIAAALVFGGLVALVLAVQPSSNKVSMTQPTTVPPTTAKPLVSVKGKPCVGLKDQLPKPFTSMPITTGPPPATLVVKDLKTGTGAVVKKTDTITADYVGVACSTGKIFDDSSLHGGPQTFPLTGVIPGWTQGVPGVKVGGVRMLGIPAALAYGSSGRQPSIAPDEALWFLLAPTKIG